ncbi:hypothetical protein HG536_0F00920 [Torulaspora globosa]|uniref:Protein kinase domain-containing protein n=1 Tax=Torulaspora globosa TaxID=48254 RepID=A0A7G3ZJT1_9SACH|nr:uncharacterized protein HG536_0F00920 [Torulaspora globosa]QLL33767.1 hypothetical protein HG536_0F00920 [Torulaspora globosa]
MQSELQANCNEEGERKNETIWNPLFMSPDGNSQQQQQPPQQQHVNFNFVNPWGVKNGEKINLTEEQELLISCGDENIDSTARRKSSLVVPPARAPGPNPFEYDDAKAYPNVHGQRQSQRPMFFPQQQLQQQSFNSGRFVPPGVFNPQDAQRRQSVAVVHYPQNLPNVSNAPGVSTPPMAPMVSPYRRLSAYPPSTSPTTSLQPPYKQLRRDGAVAAQQVVIPQMQKCTSRSDLAPTVNPTPKFRRASLNSKTISPLIALTKSLITTYSLCSHDFSYQTSKNPKRVLTKPSEPKCNNGYDNINSDYILYVNDVLGTEQNRKYLVLDILGQGTFGQVVKCQNVLTKEILAVKVVKSRTEYLNQSITEAKILELLNTKVDPRNEHHFLRLHDTFIHKNHLCLVFELLSNNLYELLKQNQFHGLTIHLIRSFTTQLLDSLCVLKDAKLVHCDLKPENILLCSPDKPELKIVDFGSSCEERRTIYTYIQSRFYRAPEVILGIPYSTSIDIWSLGCIVAELFLGIPIFPGSSEFNQLTRIINCLGYPPSWMMDMGKNTTKFLRKWDSNEINNGSTSKEAPKYKLKTVEEYNEEYGAQEQPSKQYFKWDSLQDIIAHYRISKKIKNNNVLVEQEMQDRRCLTHFLQGILNLNPLERWTPQQASMHPFITQQAFTGEWYPPGSFQGTATAASSLAGMSSRPGNIRHPSLQEGATREFNKLRIGED